MAAFSDHVQVRPEQLERWEQRASERGPRYAIGGSAMAAMQLLLPQLLGEAPRLPLRERRRGETVLARPAEWAGRVDSRPRPSEAAQGSADGGHARFC